VSKTSRRIFRSFLFSLNRPIHDVTPDLFRDPGTKSLAFLRNPGPLDKPGVTDRGAGARQYKLKTVQTLFRSGCGISRVSEIVGAFMRREGFEKASDTLPDGLGGFFSSKAQPAFEYRAFFDLIYAFPPLHNVITRPVRVIHAISQRQHSGFWIAWLNRAMKMQAHSIHPNQDRF